MRPRKEVNVTSYGGKFGVHLRTLRERAGMSVAELAETSQIPVATICDWEKNRRTPSISKFPELAAALKIKVQKLLPDP